MFPELYLKHFQASEPIGNLPVKIKALREEGKNILPFFREFQRPPSEAELARLYKEKLTRLRSIADEIRELEALYLLCLKRVQSIADCPALADLTEDERYKIALAFFKPFWFDSRRN